MRTAEGVDLTMPYSMALYPNESCPVPEVGDIFVVEEVDENVTDYHWGKCVYVKLRPVTEGVEDEVRDAMEICAWDELSDDALENFEGLLADLRLKAHVDEETLNGFEELVDQSASPHILAEEYWTYDDWKDWLMGDEDDNN